MKKHILYVVFFTLASACSESDLKQDKEKSTISTNPQGTTPLAEVATIKPPKLATPSIEDDSLKQTKSNEVEASTTIQTPNTKTETDLTSTNTLENTKSEILPNSELTKSVENNPTNTEPQTTLSPEEAELAELIKKLEEELAQYDDAAIIANYAAKRSSVDLVLGGIPLELNNQSGFVSKVSSISGATGIFSDPSGFGFTIGLSGDYLFEFDKDDLTPKATEALKSVLTLYQEYEGTDISIAGHTDSKGSNEYNQALSERRADSVKNWFIQNSIDPGLITTIGHGETKPIADNNKNGQDFPEGRALNRRVDITVKTKKKVNHLPTVSKSSGFK